MLVEDWAAELDLRILNTGYVPTCVRPQGVSIIDLSWATPSLKDMIVNWKVLSDVPSLSDHAYISFFLELVIPSSKHTHNVIKNPKWKKVNEDMFLAAPVWYGYEEPFNEETSAEERADWIASVLRDCCDAEAPRAGQNTYQSQVYWWNDEVACVEK